MSFVESVGDQFIHTIPRLRLECGETLHEAPLAYKTWGKLNAEQDNCMIICHAFTGSSDVEDWWGPLMGPGKAFDTSRYFVFCGNVLGSPYGSASPVTRDPLSGELYGPEFPPTTIRDDVYAQKTVLDSLGVRSVAVVIGGSMGGMAVLEWPLCTPSGYVRNIIPLATSARHSAWGISWGETQRQCIYSDPAYMDGYYDITHGQPKTGLAAARMAALLTYRSRDSFETRFGRRTQVGVSRPGQIPVPLVRTSSISSTLAHNEGHKTSGTRTPASRTETPGPSSSNRVSQSPDAPSTPSSPPPIFTAQSYLRYQGDKFTSRFDANCYIHLSRKLDTHDIARGRYNTITSTAEAEEEKAEFTLADALARLPPKALVISIQSDGLFTPSEQKDIADHISGATLTTISSPEGHDGFLLEFAQIHEHVTKFLQSQLPDIYAAPLSAEQQQRVDAQSERVDFTPKKTSKFGEVEVADITQW